MGKIGCEGGRELIGRPTREQWKRFMSFVEKKDTGCWEWRGFCHPYGQFWFRGANHGSHRISFLMKSGHVPAFHEVCHKCDNPRCVRGAHLFLGKHQDNSDDAIRKGRIARGDKSGRRLHPEKYPTGDEHPFRVNPQCHARGQRVNTAKLTPRQVRRIRYLSSNGVSCIVLAKKYGVDKSNICRIARRKSWRHLK